MTTIWNILGLEEATGDQKLIKKAYAKKLKQIRPDEDAVGFMALRDAFERAREYAKYSNEGDSQNIVTTDNIFEAVTENHQNLEASLLPVETVEISEVDYPVEPESFESRMSGRIMGMLNNPWERASKSAWLALFEDQELESIDAAIDFKNVLRENFLKYYGYFDECADGTSSAKPLPREVGAYIFNQMNWDDTRDIRQDIRHEIEWLKPKLDVINNHNSVSSDEDIIHEPIEEGRLFWQRMVYSVLFLAGGLGCLINWYFNKSVFSLIIGVILIARFARMWFLILWNEWG